MSLSGTVAERERSAHVDRALITTFMANVPAAVFFKDRNSRFIAVSMAQVRRFGRKSANEVIGRTDFDFFSPVHAWPAYEDEQEIMRSGVALRGKLEREVWPDGRVTWSMTDKLPLHNNQGTIIGTFGISRDVTQKREMEIALEKARKELVDMSRVAGMAEVATGVLHNVGNVLSSLNVSASVIATGLRQSKAPNLAKLAELLREHQGTLGDFLTNDPKGKRIPEYLASLAQHTAEERARLMREIVELQKNVDHIREIVSMQQAYATSVGVAEPLDAAMLMDDALRMNSGALLRHHVQVTREFRFAPPVFAERGKVLQILVNLIRNAKYACDDSKAAEKHVSLRVEPVERDDGGDSSGSVDRVRLIVQDNGVGIPQGNLTRIFAHGFTTRANGHGFGLHSAANAAREMKGSLTVHSAGPGQGATFTLELPAAAAVSVE